MSKKHTSYFMAALVWHLSFLNPFAAQAKERPITPSMITATWIGITEADNYMIRAVFREDGGGLIAYSFLDDDPCVFPLEKWALEDGVILFSLTQSPGGCTNEVRFQITARGGKLYVDVIGKDWVRSASLRPEKGLLERWSRLKNAMNSE